MLTDFGAENVRSNAVTACGCPLAASLRAIAERSSSVAVRPSAPMRVAIRSASGRNSAIRRPNSSPVNGSAQRP